MYHFVVEFQPPLASCLKTDVAGRDCTVSARSNICINVFFNFGRIFNLYPCFLKICYSLRFVFLAMQG
jgi:hypothetical protein